MKILCVADLHYALRQFDWLAEAAPSFDITVVAGDLLDVGSHVDRRAQIVVVTEYLRRIAETTRLIVCSGNHDLDAEGPGGENVAAWLGDIGADVVIDGQTVDIGPALISVCPWWDGPETRSAVARQLEADSRARHGRWIWVHHAPPADSPVSWGGSRYFGDTALVEWIDRFRPDLVLSGHVHQSPFVPGGSWIDRLGETWVFNTGQQPGDEPAHIALELTEDHAIWLSTLAPAEAQKLSGRLTRPVPPPDELPDWLRVAGRP